MKNFVSQILLFSAFATFVNVINHKPVLAQNCDPNTQTCFYDWVDKEIKLEVDVSDSISNDEYTSQLKSYVTAFRTPALQQLIASNSQGIAVSLGFWASNQSRPIANFDSLSAIPSTFIVNPSVFGSNSAIGSEWFILRYNGRNDPKIGVMDNTNPAYAFSSIIDYFSNINYRTNFLAGLATATNPAGAIRSANEGYLTDNGVNPPYISSGFKNNTTGDPFANNLGTSTNPYIQSSYERIIDISTDGIQNTNINGNNPQSGSLRFPPGNPNTSNCITINICQTAIDQSKTNFLVGADNRGNVVNAIGIANDPIIAADFNFQTGQTIGTYLSTGATIPQNFGVPDPNDQDRNYQPDADTLLGPLTGSNSPDTAAIALEANCFDQSPIVPPGTCTGANQFTTALISKLSQELEPVPFEFKPGFGLLIGVGIFSFRHWQLNRKKGKKDQKIKKNTAV